MENTIEGQIPDNNQEKVSRQGTASEYFKERFSCNFEAFITSKSNTSSVEIKIESPKLPKPKNRAIINCMMLESLLIMCRHPKEPEDNAFWTQLMTSHSVDCVIKSELTFQN